jgi:4'-phosphopantetheinyl transferase
MDLHWLEQSVNDIPFGDEWLSANERSRLSALHFPKRCNDWRLGRWTAKSAVAEYLGLPHEANVLAGIEVRTAPSGAPEVFLRELPAPVAISLSHCGGFGLCAIACARTDVGCDLEKVESRSRAFLTDYFTESEQELVAQAPGDKRDRLLTLLWSAKESALKAMHSGLRQDTRSISVLPQPLETCSGEWQRLTVEHECGGRFSGWWRESRNLVRTILVSGAERVLSLHAMPGYVADAGVRHCRSGGST